ncbi:hypothetical protein Moror_4244 [Moniliophthora roreri MCA 2997]|uniref:Uncharacterized protein n=2 Tax=Moniliophthora roreri TaxID=221103 RepID=V2WUT8_MONRO|nr:hypothetical protein Moror_4244 [Moniliophthora roreri MCA 2997]
MSFKNSSHTVITGESTLNHVHGHQVNGTINAEIVNFNAGQAVVKRTEYDEFEYIKRGHFTSVVDLGSIDLGGWDWKWRHGELIGRHKTQKTICTIEIIDRKSKFTAMFYEGKDAHRFWEDDFRQFSQIENPGSFRLFGINQSAIPALIFHHELIPMAHFFTGSLWMDIYLAHLRSNMQHILPSLWMNTASGVLCSGPEGPYVSLTNVLLGPIVVPRTVDMLKDDTSFRFFSKFGSSMDDIVMACARCKEKIAYLDDLFPVTTDHETEDPDHPIWVSPTQPYIRHLWRNPPRHLPMNVVGGLRFDTIYSPSLEAVAKRPRGTGSLSWWENYVGRGFVDQTALDGGLMRFKFDPTRWGEFYPEAEYDRWNEWLTFMFDPTQRGAYLRPKYDLWKFRGEWLSQSCHIFDTLDVTEGEQNFFIIDPPDLKICESTCQYECLGAFFNLCDGKPPIEETQPLPIYLFLHPLPTTISELVSWFEGHFYFWSFDETGRCEMSEEECERWGLPVLTCTTWWKNDSVELLSWPTSTYTALRNWQKARGFDLTTSDWALELGYPEWEIIGARKDQSWMNGLRKLLTFKKVGGSWWEALAGPGVSVLALAAALGMVFIGLYM